MNEGLIENWNSTVKKEDSIYVLGDFALTGSRKLLEPILYRLNGKKFYILGNHRSSNNKDWFKQHFEWIKDYYELYVQDKNISSGKQLIVLSHYAFYVFNQSHRLAWNLFGHSHGTLDDWSDDRLSIDVGVDSKHTNYRPISYEEVKEIMLKKKAKIVDHHNHRTNP